MILIFFLIYSKMNALLHLNSLWHLIFIISFLRTDTDAMQRSDSQLQYIFIYITPH